MSRDACCLVWLQQLVLLVLPLLLFELVVVQLLLLLLQLLLVLQLPSGHRNQGRCLCVHWQSDDQTTTRR